LRRSHKRCAIFALGVSFSTHVKAGMMNPSDFSGYKGFKGKGG